HLLTDRSIGAKMKCIACQEQINNAALFCPYCGVNQTKSTERLNLRWGLEESDYEDLPNNYKEWLKDRTYKYWLDSDYAKKKLTILDPKQKLDVYCERLTRVTFGSREYNDIVAKIMELKLK